MDLGLYHAEIGAVAGSPGRDHTAPQLLISLWLYAYSQGISSARELARRCEFEPEMGVRRNIFLSHAEDWGLFRSVSEIDFSLFRINNLQNLLF
jgi:hypothetical protein